MKIKTSGITEVDEKTLAKHVGMQLSNGSSPFRFGHIKHFICRVLRNSNIGIDGEESIILELAKDVESGDYIHIRNV